MMEEKRYEFLRFLSFTMQSVQPTVIPFLLPVWQERNILSIPQNSVPEASLWGY